MFKYDLRKKGYVIFDAFTDEDKKKLNNFALKWVSGLFGVNYCDQDYNYYHKWFKNYLFNHDSVLIAKNRHTVPPKKISKLLLDKNKLLHKCLFEYLGNYNLWNEGLGWLAFRLIRTARYFDGYPPSRKSWGPAKNVYSLFIPILQKDKFCSIGIIPNSHNKKYKKKLIKKSKFCKEEYRVDESHVLKFKRFDLKNNECLLFSPDLIHTEMPSIKSKFTRLSLELRFVVN